MIGPVRKTALAALVVGLWACGDNVADESAGPAIGYARDVMPIVDRHCVSCHGSSGFAPFTLLSYEDVVEHGQDAVEAIRTRTMPLCAQFDESCRPSAKELATLVGWLEQGHPR